MTTPISSTSNSLPALHTLNEAELVRVLLQDDYEILEEIGRGGMAIVYTAREKALDREVAIKVLPARLAVDKEFVERFEHEARTAAKLEHPNIIPIYRVGRAGPNNDVIFFVMKLLRGQSLNAVLRERGKLSPGEVRRVLMETASALGYAAKRSVVHRDIKPDNIMLDAEGRCVVTDFGIAKAPGGQQTAAGTSLGTPRYMSPEHAQGIPLDGRSDMYSLGVVAYQCLFGKTPFDSDDPFAVLYKHINEPIPEPTMTSDEERQIYGVIARMLAKKPDDRFQTGNELIAALGGQVSDPTLMAVTNTGPGLIAPTEKLPTPLPWYRDLKRMAKKEKGAWLLACGVAFFALVAWFTLRPSGKAAADTSSAQIVAAGEATKTPAAPVAPVLSDSARKADSVAKLPPKPAGPSERALAIIAANKLKSACPKRDTLPKSKPIAYGAHLDSIHNRAKGDKMDVGFDVCGLAPNAPFTAVFTLTKLRQGGLAFTRQKPYSQQTVESVAGPRSHEKFTLNISTMSAGDYKLDLVVTDKSNRSVAASREFKIREK